MPFVFGGVCLWSHGRHRVPDFRLAISLVDDRRLPFDAVEDWIADTTSRAILAKP